MFSYALNKKLNHLFPEFSDKDFEKYFQNSLENSVSQSFTIKIILKSSINNNNNNNFINNGLTNLIINKENEDQELDLQLFNVETTIYPSYNLNEILLYLKCEPIESELLVFKNANIFNFNYINLIDSTKKLGNLLCIPKNILKKIRNNHIEYNGIFEKYDDKSCYIEEKYFLKNEIASAQTSFHELLFLNYSKFQTQLMNFYQTLLEKELIELYQVREIEKYFHQIKNNMYYFQQELFKFSNDEVNIGYHESSQNYTILILK